MCLQNMVRTNGIEGGKIKRAEAEGCAVGRLRLCVINGGMVLLAC